MTGAFIAELIIAKQTTGQAIQTHPQVQPMLGPSAEFLISFGARFVPCMRSMPGLPATNKLPCLEYTTSSETTFTSNQLCPLADICGLADANNPNQSYRFVSAIVRAHANPVCTFRHCPYVAHPHSDILFNLLVLLTLCCQIEKLIGSVAYTVVFVAGGIGGNLLGGNFGLIGQPALGASGSIYTCISLEIVDLIYNSKYVRPFSDAGKSGTDAHCDLDHLFHHRPGPGALAGNRQLFTHWRVLHRNPRRPLLCAVHPCYALAHDRDLGAAADRLGAAGGLLCGAQPKLLPQRGPAAGVHLVQVPVLPARLPIVQGDWYLDHRFRWTNGDQLAWRALCRLCTTGVYRLHHHKMTWVSKRTYKDPDHQDQEEHHIAEPSPLTPGHGIHTRKGRAQQGRRIRKDIIQRVHIRCRVAHFVANPRRNLGKRGDLRLSAS